jgi:peptidoglycan/xylan/chitin deacetylase (PgdA/CDA1 family)
MFTNGSFRTAGAVGLALLALGAGPAAAAPTVISLDFDDGWADGVQAGAALQQRGLQGTFFVISGYLGKAGYMSIDQLQQLQAAGHEIGAHSVTHPDLTTLPLDEAQREICMSRDVLMSLGLDVRSFAYPYGVTSPDVSTAVELCGFDSARAVGGLDDQTPAETIPPAYAFEIRTRASIRSSDTLAQIEEWVQAAEAVGGWYHLMFHRICDGACDPYSISLADFSALLDWLVARAPLGTVVRTQRDVIGGPLLDQVPAPAPTPRVDPNLVLNPSLEDLDPSGAPSCWQRYAWGTNAVSWAAVPGFDGAYAQEATVSSFTNGGVRLVPKLDLGHCAPPATPGHSYLVTGAYRSTLSPILVVSYRDGIGQWRWWAQGAYLPPSAAWTRTSFTTPPLPLGASAMSFGLSAYAVGTLAVDDFTLTDLGPTPPAVTLSSPPDASFVRGTVTLQASASSVVGIDHVDFLVDGNLIGTVKTAPYTLPWSTASHPDGAAQVTAHAVDGAGNPGSATANVTVSNEAGLLLNPSLEVVNSAGVPGCWQRVQWGTNAATWTQTTDSHAGALAQRVDVSSFTSGGVRLMPTLDAGPCAPAGTPGRTYTVTGWYKSSAKPTLVFSYRDGAGNWIWWAQYTGLAASASWAPFTWTTPKLPAGATAFSFGMSLYGVGSLTVDDFTLKMN